MVFYICSYTGRKIMDVDIEQDFVHPRYSQGFLASFIV